MQSVLLTELKAAGLRVHRMVLPGSTTLLFRPDLKLVVVNESAKDVALSLALQQVHRAVAGRAADLEPESSS